MVLARRLSRGLGERTQSKELRQIQAPQMGLKESLIPLPQNTTVAGTEIIAINGHGSYAPILINSAFRIYGNVTNTMLQPFLNLKKGEQRRGKGIAISRDLIPSSGNKAWACAYSNNSRQMDYNQASINSFDLRMPKQQYINYGSFASFSLNDTVVAFTPSNSSYTIGEESGGTLRNLDYFSVTKGGIVEGVTMLKGLNVFNFTKFNDSKYAINTIPYQFQILPSVDRRYMYRISLVEHLGTLTYSESNTNRNANARKYLNSVSGYVSKFDPLQLY